nr:hypothetical protein [Tanacetum cinerariifolium]
MGSKPDKNGNRVEAEKSLKQLQWIKEEKPKKTQKEWSKTHTRVHGGVPEVMTKACYEKTKSIEAKDLFSRPKVDWLLNWIRYKGVWDNTSPVSPRSLGAFNFNCLVQYGYVYAKFVYGPNSTTIGSVCSENLGIWSQVILEPPYESRPFRCSVILEPPYESRPFRCSPSYEESKPESPNTKPNSSVIGSEVVEVSQVKSDSNSTDTIIDAGSLEKINLDPSFGDDSMEEDVLETKQIDSKFSSQHVGYVNEKTQVPPFKEGEPLDVMANDTHDAKNDESAKDTSDYAVVSTKRKLN